MRLSAARGEREGAHLGIATGEERGTCEAEEDDVEETREGEDNVREDCRSEWDVTPAEGFESDDGDREDGDGINQWIKQHLHGDGVGPSSSLDDRVANFRLVTVSPPEVYTTPFDG